MQDFPFKDRWDAGERLGRALTLYKNKDVLVLAIPRGGAIVGYQVASHLHADFSILVARKLPFPDNPESGFGAVAEDSSLYLFDGARAWLPDAVINRIIAEQKEEAARRIAVLRKGKPLPPIAGRTVILVDDGIAMGSTMRAAIANCRNEKAARIVAAAPVSGRQVADEIARIADEMVVLQTLAFFHAVAQVYQDWYDLSDEEVIEILKKWEQEKTAK